MNFFESIVDVFFDYIGYFVFYEVYWIGGMQLLIKIINFCNLLLVFVVFVFKSNFFIDGIQMLFLFNGINVDRQEILVYKYMVV